MEASLKADEEAEEEDAEENVGLASTKANRGADTRQELDRGALTKQLTDSPLVEPTQVDETATGPHYPKSKSDVTSTVETGGGVPSEGVQGERLDANIESMVASNQASV